MTFKNCFGRKPVHKASSLEEAAEWVCGVVVLPVTSLGLLEGQEQGQKQLVGCCVAVAPVLCPVLLEPEHLWVLFDTSKGEPSRCALTIRRVSRPLHHTAHIAPGCGSPTGAG